MCDQAKQQYICVSNGGLASPPCHCSFNIFVFSFCCVLQLADFHFGKTFTEIIIASIKERNSNRKGPPYYHEDEHYLAESIGKVELLSGGEKKDKRQEQQRARS